MVLVSESGRRGNKLGFECVKREDDVLQLQNGGGVGKPVSVLELGRQDIQ